MAMYIQTNHKVIKSIIAWSKYVFKWATKAAYIYSVHPGVNFI